MTNKLGDSFKVHIGSSEEAVLSSLAFPGATKKNKPTIKVGFLRSPLANIDSGLIANVGIVNVDW